MKVKLLRPAALVAFSLLMNGTLMAQTFQWAGKLGGTGDDRADAIAYDKNGNSYVVGRFQGLADLDPSASTYNLTSLGTFDMYVCKISPSGNLVWAKQIGGASANVFGFAITVDANKNVYTTGSFSGNVDFNPGSSSFNITAQSFDVFISKLDSSGNYVWAGAFIGPGLGFGYGIAVDPLGSIYTTGTIGDSTDFDPGNGVYKLYAAAATHIYVSKLDPSGKFRWASIMGNNIPSNAYGIALDGSCNVISTGTFKGTVDFDPGNGVYNVISQSDAAFVCKFDSAGSFIAAAGTPCNTGNYAKSRSVAVDKYNNIYYGGELSGTADFDPGSSVFNLSSAGGNDIFVSKLNPSCSLIWAKRMGSAGGDMAQCLTVDATNNVYLTGYFSMTTDFDPGSGTFNLTSKGGQDIFIEKLDSAANFGWAAQLGGTQADWGYGIAVDAKNNVYNAGYFAGTGDFDPTANTFNLTSAGGNEAYVVGAGQQITTSIPVPGAEQSITVFPNPVKDHFSISGSTDLSGSYAELLDVTGRLLRVIPLENNVTGVERGEIKRGIYILSINTPYGKRTLKIVFE